MKQNSYIVKQFFKTFGILSHFFSYCFCHIFLEGAENSEWEKFVAQNGEFEIESPSLTLSGASTNYQNKTNLT